MQDLVWHINLITFHSNRLTGFYTIDLTWFNLIAICSVNIPNLNCARLATTPVIYNPHKYNPDLNSSLYMLYSYIPNSKLRATSPGSELQAFGLAYLRDNQKATAAPHCVAFIIIF